MLLFAAFIHHASSRAESILGAYATQIPPKPAARSYSSVAVRGDDTRCGVFGRITRGVWGAFIVMEAVLGTCSGGEMGVMGAVVVDDDDAIFGLDLMDGSGCGVEEMRVEEGGRTDGGVGRGGFDSLGWVCFGWFLLVVRVVKMMMGCDEGNLPYRLRDA
ncbi:hypothetical protein GGS21DRAFT_91034 [Xylaria nigripes]|nr:hypothetical protein GGS21DRAFT_91034 [Xylaria nigripes]